MSISLKNKHIVITRSIDQSSSLKDLLETKGAEVTELPLIRTTLDFDTTTKEDVFAEIATYEWIVFTSANGVRYFFELFFKQFKDIRCLGPMRIACIGSSTANELEKLHLQVDLFPQEANSESLAKALIKEHTLDNIKILVIVGSLNSDHLAKILEKEGKAIVDTFRVYKTEYTSIQHSENASYFREKGADAILFTSSSTVHSFCAQSEFLQLAPAAKIPHAGSMGPSTSATLHHYKIHPAFESEPKTVEGFVESLSSFFSKKDKKQ